MAEKHEIEALAQRMIDTLNAHDVAAMRAIASGSDEEWAPWERAFTAFFRSFPDYRVTVRKIIVGEDDFAVFYTASGTHSAEFPAGELAGIPASGKKLTWQEAVWQHVTPDGKIGDGDLVIAGHERLQQLGVLPAPGSDFPE